MANASKVQYHAIDPNFSNPKLKKAYAKLRAAFDEAKQHRETVIEPARVAFDELMKEVLVDKDVAADPSYIEISHRYGLQYAVHDEPIPDRAERKAKSAPLRV